MEMIIEKNDKVYAIEKHMTDNRWYFSYSVHEYSEDGIKFVGKFIAMSDEDVIEQL